MPDGSPPAARGAARSAVERLGHPDARLRIASAEILGILGDAGPTQAMVERSILDPVPRVRYALLAALERIGWTPADWVSVFSELLAVDDPIAVARAAWAIGKVGPDARAAVPELRRVATDASLIVDPRWSAVVVLERLGAVASNAASELVSLLRDDPDPDLREAAARALGAVRPDADSVRELVSALDDPDHLVRESALEGLQEIGPPAARPAADRMRALLADPWPTVRRTAVRALLSIEADGVEEVPASAHSDHEEEVERRLGELIAGIESGGERRRQISTFEIGKLGPEGAVAVPLLADLYCVDENLDVRWSAAWACGKMEERALEATPALLRGLVHDLDPDVRAQTAWALGRFLRTPSAWSSRIVDGLLLALGDPDSLVREESVRALGAAVPLVPAVEGAIGARLADRHPLVRERARAALALALEPDGRSRQAPSSPRNRSS